MHALLALLLAGAPAVAGPPAAAPQPWSPVTWREGAATRTSYVSPVELAELSPDDAGAAALRAADAHAQVALVKPTVRLWTVADAKAVRARLPAGVARRVVVVLHDGPTDAAKRRVAAGDVVVVLSPALSADARAAWAREHGARPLGKALLLTAAPGQPSLELAARLAADPQVALATPNWWLAAKAR